VIPQSHLAFAIISYSLCLFLANWLNCMQAPLGVKSWYITPGQQQFKKYQPKNCPQLAAKHAKK
jgi:hypothetical protein